MTVVAHSPTSKAFGRAFISYTSGNACFVSPSFLERLDIRPLKLQRPIPATSIISSPSSVTHYTILELSSPYRESYHFKQVFYVMDLSFYKLDLPSSTIVKLAKDRGMALSHEYDTDKSHNKLDFFLGKSHLKLTGLDLDHRNKIALESPVHGIQTDAYYTHFGYMLTGDEKKPRSSNNNSEIRTKRKAR